jgi:hypothetical protein
MPYQHLNAAERQVIQRAREAGESFPSIAKTLGRSPSTVSREWRRNREEKGTEGLKVDLSAPFIPHSRPVREASGCGVTTSRTTGVGRVGLCGGARSWFDAAPEPVLFGHFCPSCALMHSS